MSELVPSKNAYINLTPLVYKKLQRRQNIIGIITDSGNRKIVSLDRNILVILNIGSPSK